MEETIKKINEVLDQIRPYLNMEGGDIEFVEYKDNIVYITLTGNCEACPLIDVTLKDGIEQMITTEIPEVKEVINVD